MARNSTYLVGITPAALLLALFFVGPALWALYSSLTNLALVRRERLLHLPIGRNDCEYAAAALLGTFAVGAQAASLFVFLVGLTALGLWAVTRLAASFRL